MHTSGSREPPRSRLSDHHQRIHTDDTSPVRRAADNGRLVAPRLPASLHATTLWLTPPVREAIRLAPRASARSNPGVGLNGLERQQCDAPPATDHPAAHASAPAGTFAKIPPWSRRTLTLGRHEGLVVTDTPLRHRSTGSRRRRRCRNVLASVSGPDTLEPLAGPSRTRRSWRPAGLAIRVARGRKSKASSRRHRTPRS